MEMKRWRRLHVNGWTAEVALRDGLYYHRTHESHIIPGDFKESKIELASAQTFADDRVPSHPCKCPGWEEWPRPAAVKP
jgi:hypothetical protein